MGTTIGAGTPRLETAGESAGGGDGSLKIMIAGNQRGIITSLEPEPEQLLASFLPM